MGYNPLTQACHEPAQARMESIPNSIYNLDRIGKLIRLENKMGGRILTPRDDFMTNPVDLCDMPKRVNAMSI